MWTRVWCCASQAAPGIGGTGSELAVRRVSHVADRSSREPAGLPVAMRSGSEASTFSTAAACHSAVSGRPARNSATPETDGPPCLSVVRLPAQATSERRESADHVPDCRWPPGAPKHRHTFGVPAPPRDVATHADNDDPMSPLGDAVVLRLYQEVARIVGEQGCRGKRNKVILVVGPPSDGAKILQDHVEDTPPAYLRRQHALDVLHNERSRAQFSEDLDVVTVQVVAVVVLGSIADDTSISCSADQ